MDAFDIAQMMANQDAKNPLKMRYGTVSAMGENGSLSVVPDGQTAAIPAIKCCRPSVGSRVVMLVNGTEWLAVSVIGGDYQSADDVVDRGSSETWTWRKYASGDAECWTKKTWSMNISQAYGSGFYMSIDNFPLPSSLFTETPVVSINSKTPTGLVCTSLHTITTSVIGWFTWATTNLGVASVEHEIQAIGRWR